MAKTVLDAMKADLISIFEALFFLLLSITEGETVNKETGEVNRFVRLEVEVPRGYGALSRCRFTVKIPDGKPRVDIDDLDTNDYVVRFDGLNISYIDAKGTVYFRADDCEIKQEV